MTAFQLLLAGHIGGGGLALVAGPVPMLSRKGSLPHRRAGKVYAAAMVVASASAFVLAVVVRNILLLDLAVFTFFLIFNGVRAIALRRGGGLNWLDWAVCALTIAFSAWLLGRGAMMPDITSLFFGAGGILLAVRQVRALRSTSPDWLTVHLASMGGAYIATVTAFLVVNLTGLLPSAVVFVTPTLVGVPLIALATTRYRRRLRPTVA